MNEANCRGHPISMGEQSNSNTDGSEGNIPSLIKESEGFKMKRTVLASVAAAMMATSLNVSALAATPALSASPLSNTEVKSGGSITFTLKYTNDIKNITLSSDDIELDGFDGDIYISTEGNCRVVYVSNIRSTNNSQKKRITIKDGSAVSSDNRKTNSIKTQSFKIK